MRLTTDTTYSSQADGPEEPNPVDDPGTGTPGEEPDELTF